MQNFSVDSNIPFLVDILNDATPVIASEAWQSTVLTNRLPRLTARNAEKNVVSKNQRTVNMFSNGEITNQQLIDSKTNFLIVRSNAKVNRELLEGTNVEFVATATTGFEHIDTEYLKQNKIKFFAASGANSNSVAEYTVFSILLWAKKNNFSELQNKKVGIIGFGNIGSKVAKYLDFMKIKYLICDPFVEENYFCNPSLRAKSEAISVNKNRLPHLTARNDGLGKVFCDVDAVIENCEIITVHTPLTFDGNHPTFNLLNENRINKIKNNSLLISAARGEICDEKAMINRKNELDFAIDVWENEPVISNRELLATSLLATPHIAGHSFQGKLNATVMIAKHLNEFYKMDLDLSEISEKICLKNPFEKSEMTDYFSLFEALNKSRELLKTSSEMKQNSKLENEKFKQFFNTVRLNYPKYFEILDFV